MKAYTSSYWLANLANLLCFGGHGVMVLLPLYLERNGLEPWEIGVVGGAFSLTAVATRFELGGWLDQHGRRRFFRLGSALMAVMCLGYLVLPPTTGIMAALRALQGVGVALYATATWTWIADCAPPGRMAELQGIFGISGLLAGALGPICGEQILTETNFDGMFWLAAALGGAGFLVLLPLPEAAGLETRIPRRGDFFRLLSSPRLTSMLIGTLPFGLGIGLLYTFVAPFVAGHDMAVAPFFAAQASMSITVRILAGRAADRLGPARIIPLGLAVQGLGLALLFPLEHGGTPLVILAGLLNGAGHGAVFPALSLLTLQRTELRERGTGMAVFTAVFESGLFLGAFGSGFLATSQGYASTFLAGGLFLMLGGLVFHLRER